MRLTHRSDGSDACIFVTLSFAYRFAPKKDLSISSIKTGQQEILSVRKAITLSFWRVEWGFNSLQGKAVSSSDDVATVDKCSRAHRDCWICWGMQECIPRQFIPIHVFSSHNPTLWNWLNTTVCKDALREVSVPL